MLTFGPSTRDALKRSVADALTDVAAVLLLLAGLFAPWARGDRGADHLALVVLTAVAVLSMAVRHLAAAGHAPPTWTVREPMRVRLLAAGAYGALVAFQLAATSQVWPLGLSGWSGNGAALGLGLVGAVLVAHPRRSELVVLGEDRPTARLWRGIAAGMAGACVLLLLAGTATGASTMTPKPNLRFWVLDLFLQLTASLAILVLTVPLLALVLGHAAWRPAVIAVGASLTGAMAIAVLVPGADVVVLEGAGNSLCVLPAAAIAVGSPVTREAARAHPVEADDPDRWREATRLCTVLAALAVLGAAYIVWEMLFHRLVRGPEGMVVVIGALLLAASALVLRQLLLRGGSSARSRAALAVGVVLLGSVTLIADHATQTFGITSLAVAGDLGPPIVLLFMLVVIPSVRQRIAAEPVHDDSQDQPRHGLGVSTRRGPRASGPAEVSLDALPGDGRLARHHGRSDGGDV